jgi:zinc/manganese transport system substrate-binding protein/manganese/iron transport system substrate-binding protein
MRAGRAELDTLDPWKENAGMDRSRHGVRLSLSRQFGVGAAIVACAVILAACQAADGPGTSGTPGASGGERPAVVATTTVFANLVRQVGGERVEVASIIPAGVGPEDYEPRPEDARALADADLVVSNGAGLDDFLDGLVTGAGSTAPRLVLTADIPILTVDGEANPHVWLDPSVVADHFLPAIAEALTGVDPAGAADYDARATSFAAELRALDNELATMVESIPAERRKLVTFHDAFPYFARHYGFEVVGVILENPGQEPSAADLAALVARVKAAGVRAVFSEAQFSPRLAQTLADEAGIREVVTTLYTDSLGDPPVDTYEGMMRWDMEQIVQAMQP